MAPGGWRGVVVSWGTGREAGDLLVRSGAVGEIKSGFAQNKLSIESPSKSDNAGSGCQWRNWGLMRAWDALRLPGLPTWKFGESSKPMNPSPEC